MAAINSTPNPADLISDTQALILSNFNSINTAFNLNHGDFGAADEGKHRFLQMPQQGAAPTTAANEAALYSAVGVTSTVAELVFRRESDGASIPFTEGTLAQRGWTRLPSGILLKWAQETWVNQGDATTTVNFNYNIGPAFTTVYQVQTSTRGVAPTNVNNVDIHAQVITFTIALVTIKGSRRITTVDDQNFNFTWLAIGD